ncbi:MAG: glycerol-3-phosphate acyltransferase PlsY [Candidatus Marinamargulisbacteria bacterium]|jgi:glycerol-3-phosphate acyltransferase PlsY
MKPKKGCLVPINLVTLGIASFFLGAVPFALIVTRIKGVDLRKVGSGNLGATNVYRALGLKYALLVFAMDALKGYIPVYFVLTGAEDPLAHILIGFLAILGHSFSPFVGFKGGKGAATGLGVLCGLSPHVFLIVFVVAAVSIYLTRMVAPVSILCSLFVPVLLRLFSYPIEYIWVTGLIAGFILVRHRANVVRLFKGTENKI